MKHLRKGRAGAGWLMLLLAAPAAAVTIQDTPLEITGFLDVLYTTDDRVAGEPDFRFGQVEIDLSACLAPDMCACVALARDDATDAFAVGTATLEYLVAGNGSDCRHHYEKWERSGVTVGRFDVPFGLDWRVYPSVDRRTVSAPDIVGATHDGWNELGVCVFIEAPRYTVRAWLTNGLQAELADDDEEPVPLATESAVGARVSVEPLTGLEAGLSAATFAAVADGQAMSLWGADLAGATGPWELCAEYIRHDLDFGPGHGPVAAGEVTNQDWYAQGTCDLDGWYLFARYDAVDAGLPGQADRRTLTGGLGLAVAAPAELRLEYRGALDDEHADSWQAQLVAGF